MSTINGQTIARARVQIPAWGVWFADVELTEAEDISGSVDLVVADRTFAGTVVSGGPYQGRARYRVAGGKGGWGTAVKAAGYANDAGVKLATVLQAAAQAAGETLGTVPDTRLGAHYARREGPASAVLNGAVPNGWYVDDAGVTRIGRRPATTYEGSATLTRSDLDSGVAEFATDELTGFNPGVTAGGVTASDVEIDQTESRLTVRLYGAAQGSRATNAMQRLIAQLMPDLRYAGVWEYRVVSQSGERLNLQPIRAAFGLPELTRVPVRYGVPAMKATISEGSIVLVAFANQQPSRPVVVGFDDPDSPGWDASSVFIGAGASLGVARQTDPVVAGPFGGTITGGSTKTKAA